MEAHASTVKDNGLLVDDFVVRSKALLTLGHNGVVDKFRAADVVVDQFRCCNILSQTFDVMLALLTI